MILYIYFAVGDVRQVAEQNRLFIRREVKMDLKAIKTRFCGGFILSCILGLFLCQNALCADPVSFKDGLLSVNLKETSLLDVARNIEKQSGVWFRGDETLFQEKISVAFNDLPLEEGLKRILANLNYSLMFDNKNTVAGVMVMSGGTAIAQPARPGAQPSRATAPPKTATRPAPAVRSRPSTSTPPSATVRRPPRVIPQPGQAGPASQTPGSGAAQSSLPDASKTQSNAPGPGGAAASDGPLPAAFRVIENAPPPGGPVKTEGASPGMPKATGSTSSPGGTPQGTAAGPGDSKPAAGAPSPEDTTKNDTP